MLAALATSFLLVKTFGAAPEHGRFSTIDGMRGYLAFFVFLHHACIWYFYLRTGQWEAPPSRLFVHFGQSGVAFFFMITGFLFFSKIIDGKVKPIDWGRLFVSRFLRLMPLYSFAMLLLFLVVAVQSNGVLNEPILKIVKEMVQWLGFTILGTPNINGVKHTGLIVALVTWSLPYEVFFYLLLPLFALCLRVVPPVKYIVLSMAGMVALSLWHPDIYHLISFLGGIAASFLVRSKQFVLFSAKRMASLIVIASVAAVVILFPSTYEMTPLILLSVAFALIAGGNSLFGVLTHVVSRTLGEMAYSIYMLHGILLFVVFTFVLGVEKSSSISSTEHWIAVVVMAPILVLVSFSTFRMIERPAMRSAPSFTAWLRSLRRVSQRGPVSAVISDEK